jgi:ABC-type amino acid transport substrate-binding protein
MGLWRLFWIAGLAAATALARANEAAPMPKLWIGVEGANPPYHFVGADRRLTGLEVELVEEICRRLASICLFRITQWEALKPALAEGRIDMAVASFSIPRRPLGKVAYSRPLYRLPHVAIVRRSRKLEIGPPEGWKDLRIGVEKDSPAAEFAARRAPSAQVTAFGSRVEALLDLAAERLDMVIVRLDHAATLTLMTIEGGCCRIHDTRFDDPILLGRGVGIGLRAADIELKRRIDEALAAMEREGTAAEIMRRWLLVPPL